MLYSLHSTVCEWAVACVRLCRFSADRGTGYWCGLGLAKGWSAEKLEVLVTRYVSKLLKAKLTTLARNVNDVA